MWIQIKSGQNGERYSRTCLVSWVRPLHLEITLTNALKVEAALIWKFCFFHVIFQTLFSVFGNVVKHVYSRNVGNGFVNEEVP